MVNIVLGIVVVLMLAVVVMFVGLGVKSRSGTAPGLVAGRLAPCPTSPNCVCSEDKQDSAHYIEPLSWNGHEPSMPLIKTVIEKAGGRVQRESNDYLAATFSSTLFGFVDDVELRVDPQQKVIQLRSASRVGHGDLGANRKRVVQLKQLLSEKLNATPH